MKDLFLLNFVLISFFDKYVLFFKLKTPAAVLTTAGVIVTSVLGHDEPESPAGALAYLTIKPFQGNLSAGNPVALYATFAIAPIAMREKASSSTVRGAFPKKVTDTRSELT